MNKILTSSNNYKILGNYEIALLESKEREIIIGDFYGDVVCAIIDFEERWCISAGCGMMFYMKSIIII